MSAIAKQQAGCLLLKFSGMDKGLCLPEDITLLAALDAVLPSWTYTSTPKTAQCEAANFAQQENIVTRVWHNATDPRTYDIDSIYVDEPMYGLSAASTVCALLADALEAYIEESGSPIALHCGAFAISGRLIALSGPRRAGKSTLIARMCAEPDLQIFCDDVLPIDPSGHAIGLGIAPRLRLPLPTQASPEFKQFAKTHLGPHDERYGYLTARNIAKHGTRLPLNALVILDRQENAMAHLRWLAEDDALFCALEQNMGQFESPEAALAQTQQLLGRCQCLRLVYHDLGDAVDLLLRAFDCPEGIHPDIEVEPATAWRANAAPHPEPVAPEQAFECAAGTILRRVGQSAFLWRADNHAIWRLNTVAEAIWALLETPGNAQELAETLKEVFVQVPKAELEKDLVKLLALMLEEGFIKELSSPLALRS